MNNAPVGNYRVASECLDVASFAGSGALTCGNVPRPPLAHACEVAVSN